MITGGARVLGSSFLLSMALVGFVAFDAWSACDPTSFAQVLADARSEVDAACPCEEALSRRAYRRCGFGVLRASVAAEELPRSCARQARQYVRRSVCGLPAAITCCRSSAERGPRHRIVRDAERCVSDERFTACPSNWQSTVTGCDDGGCVPPTCGNGVVEGIEECEPAGSRYCDVDCRDIDCYTVAEACGNGVIDSGETCEPPGVGSCNPSCQAAACSAPAAGEIALACGDASEPALTATPAGFDLVWVASHQRADTEELLAVQLDGDGEPAGSVRIVSEGLPCSGGSAGPSATRIGDDLWAAWGAGSIWARRLPDDEPARPLVEVATSFTLGTNPYGSDVPTAIVPRGLGGVTIGYRSYQCHLLPDFGCERWVSGAHLDADGVVVPTGSGPADYMPEGDPWGFSAPSSASDGVHTLWTWQKDNPEWSAPTMPDPTVVPESHQVVAYWQDGDGDFLASGGLTDRLPMPDPHANSGARVAAGGGVFLVAWTQGTAAEPAVETEIRALRATYADGNLDGMEGVLLGTAAAQVTGGPNVAFDGSRFLVVWAEAAGASSELRGVAVEPDGTVVDATPRLLASGVLDGDAPVASTGDGRVLVVFRRQDGANVALLGRFVTP